MKYIIRSPDGLYFHAMFHGQPVWKDSPEQAKKLDQEARDFWLGHQWMPSGCTSEQAAEP